MTFSGWHKRSAVFAAVTILVSLAFSADPARAWYPGFPAFVDPTTSFITPKTAVAGQHDIIYGLGVQAGNEGPVQYQIIPDSALIIESETLPPGWYRIPSPPGVSARARVYQNDWVNDGDRYTFVFHLIATSSVATWGSGRSQCVIDASLEPSPIDRHETCLVSK